MAEHHSGPVELGAPMDYPAHEKTYGGFIRAAKWGTIIIAALLISMAVGFFSTAGMFFSAILWVVLSVIGIYLL